MLLRSSARMVRVAVGALLILAATGCADDAEMLTLTGTSVPAPIASATPTTSTTQRPPAPDPMTSDCPHRPHGSSPSVFDPDRGTYAALRLSVDDDAPSVTFNVVQWLVGDDAQRAWLAETGDPGGPPNDYYVADESDLVRTVPVSADATILRLPNLGNPMLAPGSIEALRLDDRQEFGVYWLTFERGVVVEICEQYRP